MDDKGAKKPNDSALLVDDYKRGPAFCSLTDNFNKITQMISD